MASKSKKKLISISLEEVAPSREGKLDIDGLKSAAGQIARLVKRGFRIIAVVGGGSLGEEYARISSKFSKGKHADEIKNKAAEANSLLLIAALRNLGIAVNSAPFDMQRMEEFLSNESWSVAVLANQEGEKRSSLVTSELSKKYHTALIHVANTKKAIDRALSC